MSAGSSEPGSREDQKPAVRFFCVLVSVVTALGVVANLLLWLYVSPPFVAIHAPGPNGTTVDIVIPGLELTPGGIVVILSFLWVGLLAFANKARPQKFEPSSLLVWGMGGFFGGLTAATLIYLYHGSYWAVGAVKARQIAQGVTTLGFAWFCILAVLWVWCIVLSGRTKTVAAEAPTVEGTQTGQEQTGEPEESDSFSLTVELREEDLDAAGRVTHERIVFWLGYVAFMAFFAMIEHWTKYIYMALITLAFAGAFLVRRWNRKERLRLWEEIGNRVTYVFDDQGFVIRHTKGETRCEWPLAKGFRESSEMILLYHDSLPRPALIPRRDLDEERWASLYQYLVKTKNITEAETRRRKRQDLVLYVILALSILFCMGALLWGPALGLWFMTQILRSSATPTPIAL